MPIRDTLIEEKAKKNVIVLDDAQTLRTAVALHKERGYEAENDVYLVVAKPDNSYAVASFPEVAAILEEIGWSNADTALGDLPIPSAFKVVDRASQSSGAFISEVSNHPGRTFVVVDGINFVALFINVNLSDTGVRATSVERALTEPSTTSAAKKEIIHQYQDSHQKWVDHKFTYDVNPTGRYSCQASGCGRWIDGTGKPLS